MTEIGMRGLEQVWRGKSRDLWISFGLFIVDTVFPIAEDGHCRSERPENAAAYTARTLDP